MRPIINFRRVGILSACSLAALALIAAGCGNDDAAETSDVPTVMATTSIWGDVAANVACDGLAEVTTLIPSGSDPHGFEPSLSDRGRMEDAVLIVANGLGLEERLEDTIEAVEQAGTPVFHMAEHVSTIEYGSTMELDLHDDHDDHGHEEDDHGHEEDNNGHEEDDHGHEEDDHGHEEDDHGHEEDDHGHEEDDHGHHGHGHSGDDPHVWFDPIRVANALPALSQALATHAGLSAEALDECVAAYRSELIALDAEVEEILAPLHPEDRLLITNHDALGYFADRYGFGLLGTVIPSGSTLEATNPSALQDLLEVIEHTGVAAIFSETTHSSHDAEALGQEAGVQVITLNTGSLGPEGSDSGTYIGFVRSNAQKIVDGLG